MKEDSEESNVVLDDDEEPANYFFEYPEYGSPHGELIHKATTDFHNEHRTPEEMAALSSSL